jgi:Heterokaryon incompatibility protein (HET)
MSTTTEHTRKDFKYDSLTLEKKQSLLSILGVWARHIFQFGPIQILGNDLQCIRVLQLEPGNINEEVSINLVVCELATAPRYEALSYAWGDPKPSHTIVCCGERFNVSENLYFALQHLRYKDQQRLLWIDAICIYASRCRVTCRRF